jgi:hypothetical protein
MHGAEPFGEPTAGISGIFRYPVCVIEEEIRAPEIGSLLIPLRQKTPNIFVHCFPVEFLNPFTHAVDKP